jgi:heptosyltransferase-2
LPTTKGEEEAELFFATQGIAAQDKLVGFNIGSASATKRWLPERFAQVADQLAAKGYKPIFFGSSGEKAIVAETIGKMQTEPLVATGEFSIGGLCAAIARLHLFITNDSGPMHLAVSQKVPLVAIYGPSKPDLYGPYKAINALVVRSEPICPGCADKMKHLCPDMRCMRDLTVAQVLVAARQLALEVETR